MNLPPRPIPTGSGNSTPKPSTNGNVPRSGFRLTTGNRYEDAETIYQQYDDVLDNNLKLLEQTFKQSMQFLDYLLEHNEETAPPEQEQPAIEIDDEQAKKEESVPVKKPEQTPTNQDKERPAREESNAPQPVLSDKFTSSLAEEEVQKTIKQYNKKNFLQAYKLSTSLNHTDPERNAHLKVYQLEAKELPGAIVKFEKRLTDYHVDNYENNLAYRNRVVPFEHMNPELSEESQKLLDIPSYKGFKLDEKDLPGATAAAATADADADADENVVGPQDLDFLDLKILKSEKYLARIKAAKVEKFKHRILHEALISEKSTLDKENLKWQERKNSLLNFLNVDLQNVTRSINKVNKEIEDDAPVTYETKTTPESDAEDDNEDNDNDDGKQEGITLKASSESADGDVAMSEQ